MEKIGLFVVSHKAINEKRFPGRKFIYVGHNDVKVNNIDSFRDNTGDHISEKNKYYCELTAMYWIWKNIPNNQFEYIGIEHYRRSFFKNLFQIIKPEKLYEKAQKYDFLHMQSIFHFTPEKCRLKSKSGSYAMYTILRDAISKKAPDYLPFFDQQMKSRILHYCNMLVTRRELYNQYMEFLFKILNEAETHLTEMDEITRQRSLGYMAERLLDVYIKKNHYSHKGSFVNMHHLYKIK